MIAFARPDLVEPTEPNWQTVFADMLPKIEAKLRYEFRHLTSEAQQESLQEGTVNCLVAFRRLVSQGRGATATAGTLAMFAARQVKAGRTAATKMNSRDPLSPYAQRRRGIKVERFGQGRKEKASWVESIVQDPRTCVCDQVALRIDMPQWLARFPRRMRAIARDLGLGWSTAEVAQRHRVTAARISQIRREFRESWDRLQSNAG